jgi:hypothetical protein
VTAVWTEIDEAAFRATGAPPRTGWGTVTALIGTVVGIVVVTQALLLAGVTAPRLVTTGGGSGFETSTGVGSAELQVTNQGLLPVTVTDVSLGSPDQPPVPGLTDLSIAPTRLAPGDSTTVRATFRLSCDGIGVAPEGPTFSTSAPPRLVITTSGTWPFHSWSTTSAAWIDESLVQLYCHPGT